MRNLAGFEVEGLIRQGTDTTWVPLGHFTTREAAENATTRSRWGDRIQQSRITAVYRDASGGYPELAATLTSEAALRASTAKPHFRNSRTSASETSVTSA